MKVAAQIFAEFRRAGEEPGAPIRQGWEIGCTLIHEFGGSVGVLFGR